MNSVQTDITILKYRDYAYVTPNTNKGVDWMTYNIIGQWEGDALKILTEMVEDIVELMKRDNLTVELK